jgi:TonB family protein
VLVDSVGNWIKRKSDSATSFNGRPSTRDLPVTYRTIEYYPAESSPASDTFGAPAAIFNRLALKPCSGPFVIRKSGGVLQESATKRITPAYPPAALAQGIAGSVLVELTTDETGKVISTRTISGPAELRGAAEEAAKGWEVAPTYLSKMPVKVIGTITFNFNR